MSPSSPGTDKVFGLWGEGAVDTDEIRFAEQRVEITALDIPFGGEGFRPVGVETSDAASETLGDGRHAAPDGPHAHNAECAPLHFAPEDGALFPFAAAHPGIAARDLPEQAEQQGEGVLRDRHVVGPGRVADGDARATAAGMSIMSRPAPSLATQRRLGRASSRAASRWRSFPEITMSALWRRPMKAGSSTAPAPAVQNLHIRAAVRRSSCSSEKAAKGRASRQMVCFFIGRSFFPFMEDVGEKGFSRAP